jgi:hypothetical protein
LARAGFTLSAPALEEKKGRNMFYANWQIFVFSGLTVFYLDSFLGKNLIRNLLQSNPKGRVAAINVCPLWIYLLRVLS